MEESEKFDKQKQGASSTHHGHTLEIF